MSSGRLSLRGEGSEHPFLPELALRSLFGVSMRTVVSNELGELIHKLDKVNLREEADKARSIAHEVYHLIQKLEFARRLYVLLSDSLEDNEYRSERNALGSGSVEIKMGIRSPE